MFFVFRCQFRGFGHIVKGECQATNIIDADVSKFAHDHVGHERIACISSISDGISMSVDSCRCMPVCLPTAVRLTRRGMEQVLLSTCILRDFKDEIAKEMVCTKRKRRDMDSRLSRGVMYVFVTASLTAAENLL